MDALFSDPVAVIADVHGNSDALKAVLEDIQTQGCGMILNLGDHLSGPLAAAETADMMMASAMISIRGNHDRYLIEQNPKHMGASDRAAFDQLSQDHLDWLRHLPAQHVISDQIFMCHATPTSDTTYWLEDVLPSGQVISRSAAEIEAFGTGVKQPLVLCAHTHVPGMVRLSGGRVVLNPGSVGLPAYDDTKPVYHVMQTGAPDARYALVNKTALGWQASFRSVPYDTARMTTLARRANRADWANAVSTGWFDGMPGALGPQGAKTGL